MVPFYSTSNGSSWTASTGVPAGGIIASDRVNPLKFYDYAAGQFYVSTNGGVSFTATAATGLPSAADHVNMRAVPGITGDIWLAGGSTSSGDVYGLWHSTNSGASFTQLTNVAQADIIGFGKPAPGKTYPAMYTSAKIGGVRGIFRSDDGGASWIQINDSQHQYGVTNATITGDPQTYGTVYLGTNGRGIIVGTLANAPAGFTLAPSAAAVSVTQGSSATDTITVTDVGGFTGNVTLAASGLPSGVTATFGTNPTTGSSVLTLNATSTATTGAATVTITGTSGSTTSSTTIALTVNPKVTSGFTLSASPTSLSLAQGSSATDTITVTDVGGFTGNVTLAASGLPSGVTAKFATNPATSSSVLTLNATSTATTGPVTVTITGTSGSTTASTTIALTVSPTVTTTGFACHIGYTIANQWAGGFGAAVTINNTGTVGISNWTLTWTFANGQTITQLWNGNETQSGSGVTVTNMSYNGTIPAGGSYSGMGFNGSWNNITNAVPTAFAVNGTACN
jgi:hypothetical protein